MSNVSHVLPEVVARRNLLGLKLLGGLAVIGIAGIVAIVADRREASAEPVTSQSTDAGQAQAAVPGDEVRGPGSYAFGFSLGAQVGGNIRTQNVDIDFDQFMEGFKTALTGAQPKMTDEAMQQAVADMQRRQEALALAAQTKREQENVKFLAENRKKPGVETTASGLQFQVLKAGEGKSAGPRSLVVTHYEGRLLDGTVFDSSVQRGTPAEFRVDGVIKGWQEALQDMREGDKRRLWIPSELAYGAAGTGPIPPNSVLVFEVELIDVKDEKVPAEHPGPSVPDLQQ